MDINGKTGEILIHEGMGEDRLNNFCINPAAIAYLVLRPGSGEQEGLWEIAIQFKGKEKEDYPLGFTPDKRAAEKWIKEINILY